MTWRHRSRWDDIKMALKNSGVRMWAGSTNSRQSAAMRYYECENES
jgi:hypothetical protein